MFCKSVLIRTSVAFALKFTVKAIPFCPLNSSMVPIVVLPTVTKLPAFIALLREILPKVLIDKFS